MRREFCTLVLFILHAFNNVEITGQCFKLWSQSSTYRITWKGCYNKLNCGPRDWLIEPRGKVLTGLRSAPNWFFIFNEARPANVVKEFTQFHWQLNCPVWWYFWWMLANMVCWYCLPLKCPSIKFCQSLHSKLLRCPYHQGLNRFVMSVICNHKTALDNAHFLGIPHYEASSSARLKVGVGAYRFAHVTLLLETQVHLCTYIEVGLWCMCRLCHVVIYFTG